MAFVEVNSNVKGLSDLEGENSERRAKKPIRIVNGDVKKSEEC
jgi:hypothetical protein